jgi:hypothetical protein
MRRFYNLRHVQGLCGGQRTLAIGTEPVSVDLSRAVELALAGDWESAHRIVQRDEDDPSACWIHGVLHRIEGDLANARYWYERAGRALSENESPEAELGRIAAALGTRHD